MQGRSPTSVASNFFISMKTQTGQILTKGKVIIHSTRKCADSNLLFE